MDEDALDHGIRSLLKTFGIAAHPALEAAIAEAVAESTLAGDETLEATATLRVEAIGFEHVTDASISLE